MSSCRITKRKVPYGNKRI